MAGRTSAININDGRWIDWHSRETHALLNPRLPEVEATRLKEGLQSLPPLPGHIWIATSGTSGTFKWVALSKAALLASAAGVNRFLQSSRSDIWFRPLPLFHVGGLGMLVRGQLSGAKVVDAEARFNKWNAPLFAQLLEGSGATLTALVPTQLYDLVATEMESPPSLRAVVIGGAYLPPALYARARELGWPVLPSYGMTESCSQVATAPLASLDGNVYPEGLELLPHAEARVRDERIELKGSSLLTGVAIECDGRFEYEDPKSGDGWFRTGDVGEVSGRTLKIIGRAGAYVKIGGEGVDLNRISVLFEEARLEVDPAFDAAVIALPDQRLGHALVLVCAPGAAAETVRSLEESFNRRVLPFERIREVRFEAIPRTALGKLQTAELVSRLSVY